MTDSKIQIRRNFKVFALRYCNYRISWLEQSIKLEKEISNEENNSNLRFYRKRLQEELEYRKKLSQIITATTC